MNYIVTATLNIGIIMLMIMRNASRHLLQTSIQAAAASTMMGMVAQDDSFSAN